MISSHTFELTLETDSNTFSKWLSRAERKKSYSENDDKDYALVKKGITVWYRKTKFKTYIKLLVNPSRMLGLDDVVKLWKPKKTNVAEMLNELNDSISNYFDSNYALNDFKLTRIDFTVNIHMGDCDIVSAYIKVLHNIRKVKGFSPKYAKNDDLIDADLSFDLEGNSNGMEFTAYDKAAQLKKLLQDSRYRKKELKDRIEKAKGLLRLEVKLTTQKAIRNYTDEETTTQRLCYLMENCERIFHDTFMRVVPLGDFYKKDRAVEIIEKNVLDKKLKKKMIRLLELIPKKKSLHLAVKEMNDRNIKQVMDEFYKHNVAPVTISKRHEKKHLKSLHAFL